MSVPAQENAVSEDEEDGDGESDNAPPQDREDREDDSGEHEDGHVHEGRHRDDEDRHETFENHPEDAAVPDHSAIDQYSSSGEPTQEASAGSGEAASIESSVPSENGESENGSLSVEASQSDVPDNLAAEAGSSPESMGETSSMGENLSADENSPQSAQPLQSSRPPQRWTRKRHYKIQEVIKRRQIILVQVVKEERGNKGAGAHDLSVARGPLFAC